jgi:hypothetical protein
MFVLGRNESLVIDARKAFMERYCQIVCCTWKFSRIK